MLTVIDAMRERKSTRAFTPRPVPHATLEAILEAARWAPSGVNGQPWQVCVVQGQSKDTLSQRLLTARETQQEANPDYQYYPTHWTEPYRSRRIATGKALYDALGITRQDKTRQMQAWANNYRFFGAPVGLFFLIDKGLERGSWVDMGMFIENVMLAARGFGLDTCPQAALAEYPEIVRQHLALPTQLAVICGMALGYADTAQPVNQYRLPRAEVSEFTRWYE
ncbi:MAG: nitroreductase [Gammaproteobacteria bacterium]|nr:nitroreductase [Gammaproteobacteria bacterium]